MKRFEKIYSVSISAQFEAVILDAAEPAYLSSAPIMRYDRLLVAPATGRFDPGPLLLYAAMDSTPYLEEYFTNQFIALFWTAGQLGVGYTWT